MIAKQLRKTNAIAATLIAFLLTVGGSGVQAEIGENRYRDYLLNAQRELGFNGSVLVMQDDSVLVMEGFGLADRKTATANTADTRFLLCSVTKQFTATAILQLAERGLLSLDDPISSSVSGFADSSATRITLYNLLTQTSGIVDYLSLVDSTESFDSPVPVERVISMFMEAPLGFAPGSTWQYSNSNYYLLGKIIEVVSGMSYGTYMNRNIFEPLEMGSSGFPDGYLSDVPAMAKGYVTDDEGSLKSNPAIHGSWPFAAGGLYSSIADMARWEKAVRNGAVLTEESISTMYSPYKWRYGCGWEVDTLYGQPVVSHGGMGGGYCSQVIRFVDRPSSVVILSNIGNAYRQISKMAYDLVALMFGNMPHESGGDLVVHVDPQVLEEYAGEYELAPGVSIAFRCRDGRLFTQGPGQPEIEVYPRGESEFFLKVVEGSVEFLRDSTGVVSGIIMHQGGRDIAANRVR
jgi:D-alanyl-D-alanine carboxypeptidase